MSGSVRIVPAGDSSLVVEFGDCIDADVNRRTVSLAETLGRLRIDGVRDIVPTFKSVALHFDPLTVDGGALSQTVARHTDVDVAGGATPHRIVGVPVCYGGECGPDLSDVARFGGVTESEVIALHTAGTYRVFMLGFLPGFAYMASVAPQIAAPRLETPRLRVHAGSVGIAGAQTGVYPSDSPGGWRLIGRTPLKPYDPRREEPFLFKAGDLVRFEAIDAEQYETWPRSA